MIRLEKDAELDDFDRKIAAEQLRETPEVVSESLAELRRLLSEDNTLHYDDSDDFLIMFLRPCKFYPKSAYELLKRIADFRAKNAKLLAGISPQSDKCSFVNTSVVNVLVDRDQHRRRILVMNMGSKWKPGDLDTDHLFRVLYLIHFGALMEPATQIHGAEILMDFTNMGLKQAWAFSPTFANRLLTFIQDATPLRIKAVHIVFQAKVFEMVWPLFKKFIRSKLNQRIFFHGSDLSSLHKHIDKNCLPENYGGTKPKINYSSADWYPVLEELSDTIKVWQSYGQVSK